MNRICWPFAVLTIIGAIAPSARGDAFVVPKAAAATTIAEIFIDADAIRFDFEIGIEDVPYFRPLLVEGAKQQIARDGGISVPRAADSGRSALIAVDADDRALDYEILRMDAGRRLVRDEITGEPLAEQPANAPEVVHLSLNFPFTSGRPQMLAFGHSAPADPGVDLASIGFIAYHDGLPVNDFRYFPERLEIDLNWEDPWYSRFRHRNFLRQNLAPLSAYLYVEPYEVRKEIVVRPRDLQRHVDLGLDGVETIPVAAQAELKKRVSEFFSDRARVLVDGQPVEGSLVRIHFVRRGLRTTGIIDPPEDLALNSALLGVIFSYPTEGLPEEVRMEWDLFDERMPQIPSASTDEAGVLPAILTEEDPVLVWTNHLKDPVGSAFKEIDPPARPTISLPLLSIASGIAALVFGWRMFFSERRFSTLGALAAAAMALLATLSWPYLRVEVPRLFAGQGAIAADAESDLVQGLLFNIYRSFDWRSEEQVFDRLSGSIAGDLLEQVYLDTRGSIELENQGGLQVKIREVEILDLGRLQGDLPRYRCHWRARGSVGHWGHVHQRESERRAELGLAPVDGKWKFVEMNLLDES